MSNYEAWKKIVDERMFAEAGVHSDDIEDYDYWQCWNDGYNANQVAIEALINAGWEI